MSKVRLSELRLPFILVAEIILCLLFGDLVPTSLKTAFYSISVFLKNTLVTALPLIIFSILFSGLGALKKGAFTFTALAFSLVIISNYLSTSLGGFLGVQFLGHVEISQYNSGTTQQLIPLWETFFAPETLGRITGFWGLRILQSISNDMALFAGISCGLLLAVTNHGKTKTVSLKMKHIAFLFLQKGFIPLIPLFILGYILNMQHSGLLNSIFQDYFAIITLIVVATFSYIIFLYGLVSSFKIARWRLYLKNMFPAMLTGFSTMSSASALPLLMEGAAKNTGSEEVKGVVPISINIHLIGDCFSISILALTILVSFGYPLPSLEEYMIFTLFFVLAKFAVAAVPGGGILVMIPILEKYLGFTPEMLSLITALYILFDPIVTSANVLGNVAFAQIFEKIYHLFYKEKKVSSWAN